jgi:sugar phosphate permease
MNHQLASTILHLSNLWYAILKKSLASSTPTMRDELLLHTRDIGDFSAIFSLGYGIFKLVGGVLCDIFPADQVFSMGIFLGSCINLLIPLSNDVLVIKGLWGLNGVLQGAGGPATSKIVIDYFPKERRMSTWSSLLNVSYVSISKLTHR